MKRSLFYILSLVLYQLAAAQNLVPNGSFEDYAQCPFDQAQISFATGWSAYRGTCDFVHECGTPFIAGVPNNIWGYQHAATGSGYAQVISFSGDDGNPFHLREWIGRQLSMPMIVGETYYVSVKFSWTTAWTPGQGSCQYANDKMGIRFGTDPFVTGHLDPVPNHAHVYTQNIITDSLGWVIVSAPFVADSTYEYIAVGNFFDDVQTDWDLINPNGEFPLSYYYVDDVCVSLDSGICEMAIGMLGSSIPDVQVYPNPTSDQMFIDAGTGSLNEIKLRMYDTAGRMVIPRIVQRTAGRLVYDLTGLTSGIYVLTIEGDNTVITRKVIKQ